jgi:hypothetical protein
MLNRYHKARRAARGSTDCAASGLQKSSKQRNEQTEAAANPAWKRFRLTERNCGEHANEDDRARCLVHESGSILQRENQ